MYCSFRGCDHRKTPALAGGADGLGAKTPPRKEGTGGLGEVHNCGFIFGGVIINFFNIFFLNKNLEENQVKLDCSQTASPGITGILHSQVGSAFFILKGTRNMEPWTGINVN